MLLLSSKANLTKFLKTKIRGKARKCLLEESFNNIEDFIESLKRIYSINKTVYQL